MPTRTYTGIDLINYVETDNLVDSDNDSGSASHSVIPTSQAVVQVILNGAVSDNPPDGGGALITGSFTAVGDFDFDVFPSIPSNALITKLTIKARLSFNISSIITGASTCLAVSNALLSITLNPSGTVLNNLTISGSQTVNQAGLNSAVIADSVTFSTSEEIDLAPGITKADLIAGYTTISISAGFIIANITSTTSPAPSSTGAINGDIVFNNFEMVVEYSDGTISITLDPPGGNVESGQIIRVSSPDIDPNTLNYAALQGDNVIPLIPKKDGPDVLLTVPSPSPDPCLDCLTDCPACEDCFDTCNDNLDGPECESCMQACLDCLTTCLENLESAEECNESTRNQPDPVSIIVICDGPGFTGSVPLGNFVILLTNGSGIYQFQFGKTNDTLYSSARDGETYDVKIPNPFGKTGFFRS